MQIIKNNNIMNNDNQTKIYITPRIESIKLDNEISLVLQTDPPFPGNEGATLIAPDYYNNDPFKINKA